MVLPFMCSLFQLIAVLFSRGLQSMNGSGPEEMMSDDKYKSVVIHEWM